MTERFEGEVLARLDGIDSRLEKIDARLEKWDERLRAVEQATAQTRILAVAFAAVASLVVNVVGKFWK